MGRPPNSAPGYYTQPAAGRTCVIEGCGAIAVPIGYDVFRCGKEHEFCGSCGKLVSRDGGGFSSCEGDCARG